MFFDPKDYQRHDPASAGSEVEAARWAREAAQRARLCETIARLAARHGFATVSAQQVFSAAELGSSTFYKLFEDREACLQEAFERCAGVIFARVAAAAQAGGGDFAGRLEGGLGELVDTLATDPDVARLVLVEIQAGDGGAERGQGRPAAALGGPAGTPAGGDGRARRGEGA